MATFQQWGRKRQKNQQISINEIKNKKRKSVAFKFVQVLASNRSHE